jgi:A/G-specific adenine glycosylase
MTHRAFKKLIWNFYTKNRRNLPWRNTKDPYKILVSEIMLQQTRVAQGLPYFLAFTETFPTVFDLAKAEEEQVLKLWQGLGYYARARNMQFAAKQIVNEFNGEFPSHINDILTLKGIGEYTAAAIASFAFQQPFPAIDGNVKRVTARFFGINAPINTRMFFQTTQNLFLGSFRTKKRRIICY